MNWLWANSLPLHSPVPWNHQKIIGFQQKEFFPITFLAKGSILDVWQGSEYTNEYGCKILAERLLMKTGKHKNKWVYSYKKSYALSTYSRHHCIQFPLFDFSSTKIFSLSSLHFIIHSIGTAMVKNKCCLFRKYAKRFLFYWKCSLSI